MTVGYTQDDLETLRDERQVLIEENRRSPKFIPGGVIIGVAAYYGLDYLDLPRIALGAALLIGMFVVGAMLNQWDNIRRIKQIDQQIHEIRLALTGRGRGL